MIRFSFPRSGVMLVSLFLLFCCSFSIGLEWEHSQATHLSQKRFSLTTAELVSCSKPESPTCDWYPRCIEKAHPCGPNGYVRQYGYKYCQKFAAAKGLSPIGEQWRDKTMVCLQKSLVPMLGASGPLDQVCHEIGEVGFDSHVRCYTSEPSICHLPWSDLFDIIDIIGPGFLDPTGARQTADAIAICLCEWSGLC